MMEPFNEVVDGLVTARDQYQAMERVIININKTVGVDANGFG